MTDTTDLELDSYGQFCPVAVSLDVLGDRWTILLMRDMLWSGALRFNELEERNPGLTTAVLTERLRKLETHGLAAQRDEPKRRWVLTEEGERITSVIASLYQFGIPLVATADVDDSMISYAVSDSARRRRLDLMDVAEVVAVTVVVGAGRVTVELGPGSMRVSEQYVPAATVTMGPSELAELMAGMSDYAGLHAAGRIAVEGDTVSAATVVDFFTPASG